MISALGTTCTKEEELPIVAITSCWLCILLALHARPEQARGGVGSELPPAQAPLCATALEDSLASTRQ